MDGFKGILLFWNCRIWVASILINGAATIGGANMWKLWVRSRWSRGFDPCAESVSRGLSSRKCSLESNKVTILANDCHKYCNVLEISRLAFNNSR